MIAEVLRGYALATYEQAERAGRLAAVVDELSAFVRTLIDHDRLRHVLVDPGVSVVLRHSVVRELLEGRATDETTTLLGFSVRAVPAGELPIAVAELIELAEDPAERDQPPGGAHGTNDRLRGYAERVLEQLGDAAAVDELEDELFRLARVVEHNGPLRAALSDPSAPVAVRVAILTELLASRASDAAVRLATFVIRAGRVRNLVGTYEWLVGLCAEERGRRVAEVRTPVELDDAERTRLADALGRLTNRTVEVRTLIDASVIGGILVAVGDLVLDGSVRLRVERLRDALAETV